MKDKDFNYGLICNSSCNIGDEIQSIAAARFLPHIDTYVHREQVNRFKSDKKTKLIMNAWWTRLPKTFPPSKDIIPLLISMHFKHQLRKKTPMPGYTVYFKKYGPVGCRDKATAKWLNDNGIPAYFSGCLTLTLQRNPSLKREDYILGVDLPKHIVKEIKSRTNRPVYNIPRTLLPLNLNKRFRLAKTMLYLYHNAHCVVTSRLHAAMPCLAFETPVLMLDTKNNWLRRDGRYDGLMELCNIVTEDDFMNNKDIYDFENPPANPEDYKKLREDLIKKCTEFTGYNNTESVLEENFNPTFELIKLFHYRRELAKRFAYWAEPYDTFKAWFRAVFLHKNKFDLRVEKPVEIFKQKSTMSAKPAHREAFRGGGRFLKAA